MGPSVAWTVRPAHSPNEIRWGNHALQKNPAKDFTAQLVGFVVFAVLCIFWVVPVAFAVSLANLATVKKYLPVLGVVTDAIVALPIVNSFIVGFLPQLIIIIFYALLVPILKVIENTFYKSKTQSKADGTVSTAFFAFRVVNVFLGGILANSFDQIASQLQQLAASPISIVPILGRSVPLQTNFFTQYCLVNGFLPAALKLLDPVGTLIHVIVAKCFTGDSPRSRDSLYQPSTIASSFFLRLYHSSLTGAFCFLKSIPSHTFMFLIVTVYSAISPLMLAVGLVFFAAHYVADRYDLLYRKEQRYDSGGLHWPIAFQQLCFGMLMYCLVMLSVFINFVWIFGIVVSAVAFFVILLYWIYMENTFRPLSYYGAAYPRLVESDKVLTHSETYRWAYQHPDLAPVSKEEIERVTDEPEIEEMKCVSVNIENGQTTDKPLLDRQYSDGDEELNEMVNAPLGSLLVVTTGVVASAIGSDQIGIADLDVASPTPSMMQHDDNTI